MLTGLRGSVLGAFGLAGLGLALAVLVNSWATAADPVGGPDLVPSSPEAAAPALPPVGAAIGAENQQGEALTRGPIHEAFAEPHQRNPEANKVVPRQPPDAINEVAPDVKPEGDNVEWIPGYWGWDEDRGDFIWVSGLWRKIPPGRRWVPGYWVQAEGGSRWVNGMWAEDRAQELNYLPDPPQSVESGPNGPAPSDDHFWVPGNWMYVNAAYRWRPGYWTAGYDNWIWVPARYVWSPRGCFFVPGYWDYAFARRGVVFSPVFFGGAVYRRPAFVYSPSVVVSFGGLSSNLFVGVGFGHYYFGDYYGDACFRRGFYPWHVYHRNRCWDPCLSYYAWHHRRHDHFDYVRRLEDRHNHLVKHADLRPPRTYSAQRDWERKVGDAKYREAGELGRSLRDVQNRRDNDQLKLVKVADVQRREFEQRRTQIRDLSNERSKLERVAGDGRVKSDVNRATGGRVTGGDQRPGGQQGAMRADSTRLKLPQLTGAEQRSATTPRKDGVPDTTGPGRRNDGVGRTGIDGRPTDFGPRNIGTGRGGNRGDAANRGDASNRSDDGRRNIAQPDTGRGSDGQPSDKAPGLTREGQPRDTQPRTTQPRDTQPRDSQPRSSGSGSRDLQLPRSGGSGSRDVQPRSGGSGSRDFQQPRGSGGSRDSQPRGSGRDRSGRTSVETEKSPIVTDKPVTAPKVIKPPGPASGQPQQEKSNTIVRSRGPEKTETRLRPPTDNAGRGDSGVSSRTTRGDGASSRSRSGESSVRSSESLPSRSSSSRSSGESRSSRSEASKSKDTKEDENKSSTSGRGRGR